MAQRTRQLIWTTTPHSRNQLRLEGFRVFRYAALRDRIMACRSGDAGRSGLGNPAAPVLRIFRRHRQVAVLGVGCDPAADLPLVYAYLVEPAFRCGCRLLIGAERKLENAPAGDRALEAPWGHPWSQERLIHLLERGREPVAVPFAEPVPRWRRWWSRLFPRADGDEAGGTLDPEQMAAVHAGDGVVQIIAPAGSGKTTVLIRRVRELQRRGSAPESILCMSFNRDAAVEIGERLAKAGLSGVQVRSFHAMGLALLREHGPLLDLPEGFRVADDAAAPPGPVLPLEAESTLGDLRLAAAAAEATGLVVANAVRPFAHTGFAGAVFQLGCGLVEREAKLRLHRDVRPSVDTPLCAGCGSCLGVCIFDAIRIQGGRASIDHTRCTGCGECMTACHLAGISPRQEGGVAGFQRGVAESARAVAEHFSGPRSGALLFVNFLTPIVRGDQGGFTRARYQPAEMGALVGADPVALDQATWDILVAGAPQGLRQWSGFPTDPEVLLQEAQQRGLGRRAYRLEKVGGKIS